MFRSTDPTTWDDIDDVIINESAPAPSVQGVPSNIVILVGQSERGSGNLESISGTDDFYEKCGKNNSFGMNKSLKNKKFGVLKVVRVVASDAVLASKNFASSATDRIKFEAKQGKGAYGNNIYVTIEEASSSRQEKHTIATVADVSSSLDGKYFIIPDEAGTVAFWIDVGDGGGSAPAHGADRAVEITTISANDTAAQVATKIAAAIQADSKFSASAVGTTVTVTCDAYAPGAGDKDNGDSGFTITRTQVGFDAGVKYTVEDRNPGAVFPVEVYDDIIISDINTDLPFRGSNLVNVTVLSSAAEPSLAAATQLASGADGTVADTDYETALEKCASEGAGNVVILDEYNSTRSGYLEQHVADTQDRMVIICGSEDETIAEAITNVADYRDSDGRIIYAYPWVETSIDGTLDYVNPASFYASVMSQTGPHISPSAVSNAGFLGGITKLKKNLKRSELAQLDAAGVSCFYQDSDFGVVIKNAIVTQIANSSKITVVRRRMTDYLTNSAGKFLKNYQGAMNSAQNRLFAKAGLMDFITGQENDGMLPKDSEVDGGKAKIVDVVSQNTNASIAGGFFKIKWRQRIYSSMRYIVLYAEIGESVVVTEEEAA